MVTLNDVAKAAGVTPSAVSYALSGKGTLSMATRTRILTCASELGYRPNLVARGLATQQSHTIGLLVADIANPFYGIVAQTVERTAYRYGYRAFMVDCDRNEHLARELLADLTARRVDGIVAMPGGFAAEVIRSTIPPSMPIVWCMWEDEDPDLTPLVGLDYYTGGKLAAEHLLELGHRHIAILTHHNKPGANVYEHRLRVAGCRDALASAGVPLDSSLLALGDSSVESGIAAGRSLFSRSDSPTAVFATNVLMALGLLAAAHEAGIPVPAALSIVGFDDIVSAAFSGPPLTTVRIDCAGMMAGAVMLLLDLIQGRKPMLPPISIPALIVRRSTGPAPAA